MSLKKELATEKPKIGLVALENTVVDSSLFGEMLGVDLRIYIVTTVDDLETYVRRSKTDGCEAVIGGNTVIKYAEQLGMKSAFLRSGTDAIHTVYSIANRVAYAIDLEKQSSEELDVVLNHTSGGIIQIDRNMKIMRVNSNTNSMLYAHSGMLVGKYIYDIIPEITETSLEKALRDGGGESGTLVLDIKSRTVVITVMPVNIDGKTISAILTFHEDQEIKKMDSELRYELYRRGFMAEHTFDSFVAENQDTAELVRKAKIMAKYPSPILLTGDYGTGLDILAECIHNESQFHNNAFTTIDCSAYDTEDLDNMIFGNYTTRKDSKLSLAELAENGTLYIKNIESMEMETQYKLVQLLRGHFLHNGANIPVALKVRIIAATSVNLIHRVEEHTFRGDLFYALSVLKLELLPLKRRREDIVGWFNMYLDIWQKTHRRTVKLTEGAVSAIKNYDWPGNIDQISCVAERVVLLTEKRNIGEDFIRKQIEEVVPNILPGTDKVVLYKDKKAIEIAEILKKHNGNREKVAEELGVSKTTLWRYMKKYGISSDYNY
jgi:transcriptional regulator with PAS, ATPase and Fis domain